MATSHRPRGGSRITINLTGDSYFYWLEFEGNNGGTPDALIPSDGVTMSRTGEGDYVITFDEEIKPKNVMIALPVVAENNGDVWVKCGDYVPSTGALPVFGYLNSAGTISSDDLDDVTIRVLVLCNKSELSDRA